MKTLGIEALLSWAYRDELPKMAAPKSLVAAIRPAWHSLSRFGELMTVVQETDIVNRFGVTPLLSGGDEDPHPDALAVADAVEALAWCEVGMPEGWNPLADMGDLGPEGPDAVRRGLDRLSPADGEGRRKVREPLSRLVIRHAVLGGAPVWEAEAPARRMVTGPNGKPAWFRRIVATSPGAFGPVTTPVEVDGYNHTRQRPFPGAYRKFELVPDPVSTVVERGEYELWFAALALLVEMLGGTLAQHAVLPCARSPRPWEVSVSGARILASAPASPVVAHEGRKKNSIPA